MAHEPINTLSAEPALEKLKSGNALYLQSQTDNGDISPQRRADTCGTPTLSSSPARIHASFPRACSARGSAICLLSAWRAMSWTTTSSARWNMPRLTSA